VEDVLVDAFSDLMVRVLRPILFVLLTAAFSQVLPEFVELPKPIMQGLLAKAKTRYFNGKPN
jgi:hypothetical protein